VACPPTKSRDIVSAVSDIPHPSVSTHCAVPPIRTCAFIPTHHQSKPSRSRLLFSSFYLAPAVILPFSHLLTLMSPGLEKGPSRKLQHGPDRSQARTIRNTGTRHAVLFSYLTMKPLAFYQMLGCTQSVKLFIFLFWSTCISQG